MPELTQETLQVMISEAVKGLSEQITEKDKKISELETSLKSANQEADRLKHHRDTVLAEKRALENKNKADPEPDPSKPRQEDFVLTRDQARDPHTYRKMKAKAQEAGFELKIADDHYVESAMPDRFETDDMIYVSRKFVQAGGTPRYQSLKAEAEKAGKRLHVASGANQFPKEAFYQEDDDAA